MRFIIYGAGGIGCVIGGHLARAKEDVLLIGRPGHIEMIKEHGLRLVTPSGTHTLRIPAEISPEQVMFRDDDIVLLCMKGQDTEEALRKMSPIAGDIPVFCIQNGVRNEEIASEYFPQVYGVMVRIGAEYLADGEVVARRDPPGLLVIGRYPDGMDPLADEVGARLCEAGFLIKVTPDVMPYKWSKLMGNLGNAIDAIVDKWSDDVELIMGTARKELADILEEAGIKWKSEEELGREWPELKRPPRPKGGRPPMRSSTWQSLARRQGSVETEFLNGEVVRIAARMGRQAVVNKKLLDIIREMAENREPPGKYTGSELKAIVGMQ